MEPEPEERLSLYRELVLIKDEEELKEFYELIEDKYGKMPDSVENLIKIYLLKLYMKKIGLPLIEVKGNNLVFLIKNQENLLKFRKIFKDLGSNFYFKNEKNFAKIFIRFSENPLDLAINLCKRLFS